MEVFFFFFKLREEIFQESCCMREHRLQWRRPGERNFWADSESTSGYFQGFEVDTSNESPNEWHMVVNRIEVGRNFYPQRSKTWRGKKPHKKQKKNPWAWSYLSRSSPEIQSPICFPLQPALTSVLSSHPEEIHGKVGKVHLTKPCQNVSWGLTSLVTCWQIPVKKN